MSYFMIHAGQLMLAVQPPGDLDEAWQITLAKWDFLAHERSCPGDGGAYTCGLCSLFIRVGPCRDCPVAQAVGEPGCQHTPYPAYREAYLDSLETSNFLETGDIDAVLEAAARELEFLQGVRDSSSRQEPVAYG